MSVQVCLSSTELAAVYIDERRVVENPGYIPRTCELIDMSVGERHVKLRYIHGGGVASASVSYRSTLKRNAPMLPITSPSPGWCSGSMLPRTSCFGALPIDNCEINFVEGATAREVVKSWQVAFRLQTPLVVGEYVDISLPGFEKYAATQESNSGNEPASLASATTAGTTTIFAFEVMAKSVNPGFPITLPDPAPKYIKIGCYEDVRTHRAVGGGTCGNFKDPDGVVTSVDACARITADKGFRGFCIADGSSCHTSSKFWLEYDTYNKSDDLGDAETLAQEQFDRDIQREIRECLNSSNKSAAAATITALGSTQTYGNASNRSRCDPDREFVFNTTGMKGCLKRGMGGPGTMNCYELIRKPKLASKIAPLIRCGQCAEWNAVTQTLRFVAEEYVEAGLDLVLGFNSSVLPLRAPIYGLARDDKSISLFHSRDARDVNARDMERAICRVPSIKPSTSANTSCVPPQVARTVQVNMCLCMCVYIYIYIYACMYHICVIYKEGLDLILGV
jgi:hypothetical protein